MSKPKRSPALALYQPDIAPNVGTLLRLGAGLSFRVEVIEPCGFVWDDKKLKRAGMDYLDQADLRRHMSWDAFRETMKEEGRRLVLMTTKGATRLDRFTFQEGDVILMGRESAGVPAEVADLCDARIIIPMAPPARSLNVAVAASLAMGEALRQLDAYPPES